ncbi:MAG: ABC transporter ATP-binding protein [Candidatus Bipolaricaulota bacterium]|nr:ABC transporter ATP-binding protein [Candidatus Bipolaricaulota bacterium]
MLRLEDVHVHFALRRGLFQRGIVHAVNGVSLSIAAQEIVALVGESGSGKTTLGRVSLRLERPTQGRVWFDSREISHVSEGMLKEFRRRAQAVFQDPYSSINPYMTVSQIVEEPLIIHKIGSRSERLAQVEALLEALRLHPVREFMQKFPHQMSGGQRQRVALARALILNPDYLMADEPVSMIDASSRAEILQLMHEQQKERGMAVLYITHDIATARHYAHRIGVMYLGSLVELGPSRRIIDRPLHPYTQHLIEAVPEPDPANRQRQRQVVPGEPPSPIHLPKGCFFHPRCPKFMKGLCDAARPALKEIESGHAVACYLYHQESLKEAKTEQVAAQV